MLYHVCETKLGWIGILGRDERIAALTLPARTRSEAEQAVRGGMPVDTVESEHYFGELAAKLGDYFAGHRVDFHCEVDEAGASDFERRVWAAAREVPYGQVRTYGWIAQRIGQPDAARAVGQSLGRNPVPVIVPCHRVVRSDGRLGGFSCGLDWKRRLLTLERPGSVLES